MKSLNNLFIIQILLLLLFRSSSLLTFDFISLSFETLTPNIHNQSSLIHIINMIVTKNQIVPYKANGYTKCSTTDIQW